MPDPQPGQILARGVCRFLIDLGAAPVTEFAPVSGLRADVAALGPKGEIWIVECKSSIADFRSDKKWRGYLDWCDAFYFAAPTELAEILPEDEGLLAADGFGAELLRPAAARRLSPARRTAQTRRLCRAAALRLRAFADPGAAGLAVGREED